MSESLILFQIDFNSHRTNREGGLLTDLRNFMIPSKQFIFCQSIFERDNPDADVWRRHQG